MSSYRMLIQRDKRGVLLAQKKHVPRKKNTIFLVLLSFLLPLLLLTPAFIYSGIFPFGDHTTLAVDLRNQYVGFFEAFRRLTTDPGGLLFNFTKGPGGIMSATDAYYLCSPFNFLFLLFSSSQLPLAVEAIQLLKVCFSALTFSLLLIKREHGDDWRTLLFSSCYALMSFTMANLLNVMWLDLLYMTPLVILFLERMLDGKSPVPYILSLALSIIINFYMAYMLCIFLVLYAVWTIVRRTSALRGTFFFKTKQCIIQFLRFLLFSFIAGTLTAWLLFPNLYTLLLSKGPYQENVVADLSLRYPPLDPLSRLIPAAFDYDQVSNGYANIYVGLVPSILTLFYFANPRITKRERFCSLLLVLFLLLSMNMKKLNIFWHGMQYPIWYNYRFSWVFSFFTLLIAFRGFRRMKRVSIVQTGLVFVFYAVLLLYLGIQKVQNQDAYSFLTIFHLIATFVLIVLLLILFQQWSKEKHTLQMASFLLLLFTFLDLTINSAVYTACFSYETYTEFAFYDQQMQEALSPILPPDNDFYRIEKTFMHDNNDGMRFNYSGLTHFNSTYEYNTIELLSSLGFSRGRASTAGGNATKLTDALFGIRYYLDGKYQADVEGVMKEGVGCFQSKSHRPDVRDMTPVAQYRYIDVYENPWCMPFGMLAEKEVASLDAGRMNPMDFQDHIANMLDGRDGEEINYFEHVTLPAPTLENLRQESGGGEMKTYLRVSSDKEEIARLNYSIQTQGNRSAYVTISETLNSSNSFVYLDDEQIGNKRSGEVTTSQILNISGAKDGAKTQKLSIQMHNKKERFSINHMALFTLNEEALRRAVEYQRQNGLKLTHFSSTAFSGTFQADKDTSYLLLSLPYDEGWKAKLDGEAVKTVRVLNALTAIPVSPGEHSLEMTFHVPLLLPGLCLTVGGVVFLFGIVRSTRTKKRSSYQNNTEQRAS